MEEPIGCVICLFEPFVVSKSLDARHILSVRAKADPREL